MTFVFRMNLSYTVITAEMKQEHGMRLKTKHTKRKKSYMISTFLYLISLVFYFTNQSSSTIPRSFSIDSVRTKVKIKVKLYTQGIPTVHKAYKTQTSHWPNINIVNTLIGILVKGAFTHTGAKKKKKTLIW